MKSGTAAEAIFKNVDNESDLEFNDLVKSSWIHTELYKSKILDPCSISLVH